MPPSYVKAYLKRGKNDAAAICEAVTRPSMRFVPIESVEQQGALMLHRTRDLLIRQRTQLIDALRAHLADLGLVAAKGREGLQPRARKNSGTLFPWAISTAYACHITHEF
jgi:transposase